jgi:predicted bacteriocin transport accessory protein
MLIFASYNYLSDLGSDYIEEINDIETFQSLTDEFIYFGRPTCVSCKLFLPLLSDIAKQEKITVYYFNTDHFKSEGVLADGEFQRILEQYQVEEVPMLIKLSGSEVESAFGGNFTEKETEQMKLKIKDFITYTDKPVRFIPHYVAVLIIFVLSSITAAALLQSVKQIKSSNLLFVFSALLVSFVVIMVVLIYLTLHYLEYQNYSLDYRFAILYVFTLIVCCLGLIKARLTYKKSCAVDINKPK